MAKDRKKLLHIHSSVNDKQPTPSSLEAGELAVNNAADNAFISTKNSNGDVVRFSEDGTVIDWIEKKEVFPYEGYVRGSNSGVTGVTEADLLQNKSNIIVKINQVAARNSEYDEKINGAKDIYGNPINPISADGYRDGAGIAIDMSPYAMVGSNPSFSSLTTTCGAHFNGTTEIEGTNGDCGSKFNVNVENVCIDAGDSLNEYGENSTNVGVSCDGRSISNNTTIKGKKINIISPEGDTSLDIKACSQISSVTDNYVVKECTDGRGSVEIDTTTVGVSADTTDIKSCNLVDVNTNKFKIAECNDGQGEIEINSCKGITANTDNFVIGSCSSGGTTTIKSCNGIKLESKNITLTDGDCGLGEITIEVNDLCLVGNDKINVYGDKTNVGIDCDDSKVATKTRVYGQTVEVSGNSTDILSKDTNIVGEDTAIIDDNSITLLTKNGVFQATSINAEMRFNSGSNIRVHAGDDFLLDAVDEICEKAEKSTFYGSNTTNIGVDCNGGATAATTNIKGETINIEATNTLCEKGLNSYFYGENSTHIGRGCDGQKSASIVYERIPGSGTCDIKASTVDGALEEVFDRDKIHFSSITGVNSVTYEIWQDSGSCENRIQFTIDDTIVSMSAETLPASAETAKVYTLYQTTGDRRVEIGTIDIPKDHILKDVSVVNGVYDESTSAFTECGDYEPSSACSYYIKMVWNVFDSGHTDDKTVYLPADEFVKDLEVANPSNNGVNLEIWFDGAKKKISAHTESHIVHNGTDTQFTINGDSHSINSYLLTVNSGNTTVAEFDPFSANTTIELPTCVSQMDRHKITFQSGDVSTFVEQTYDPGKDCANSAETINIPTSLKHLAEFNGNCYVLENDICMTGNTIVAKGFYSKSDVRLKENINYLTYDDYKKADAIDFKRFNFVDDETKTKTYGVIAQEVLAAGLNEIVHKDSDDTLNVDYISLLILKIANLERKVRELSEEVQTLKNK